MAAPRKGVFKELVMAVARRDICGGFVSKDSHSTRTVLGLGRLQLGELPEKPMREWVPPKGDPPPPIVPRTRADTKKLWRKFFDDPSEWLDVRAQKKNPKQPDWIHWETKQGLWLESALTPSWVRTKLAESSQFQSPPAATKSHTEESFTRRGILKLDEDEYTTDAQDLQESVTLKSMEMQTRSSDAGQAEDTVIGTSYPTKRPVHRRGGRSVIVGSDDDIRDLCLNGQPRNSLHILEQRGIDPSAYAYVCMLRRCTNMKDLAEGKFVHEHMANNGFVPSTFVLNALLNMYMKCGSLMDARQVFDRMRERDMFTWTMMLTGYAKLGHPEEAYMIYEQMHKERVPVDKITFTTILSACATLKSLEKGQRVHQDMRRAGIRPDAILGNTLIDMYAKCGNFDKAHQVFEEMSERDVVTWNIMIAGAAQNDRAFEIFEAMRDEGMRPDKVTYVTVLSACSSLEQGRELHSDIVKAGFAHDVRVATALVNMYSKCGSVEDALQVFEKLPQRNVVSWTSVISAFALVGDPRKALEYYEKMLKEGIYPDKHAYTTVLNVCATLGDLKKGQEIHDHLIKSGISVDLFTENTLIDMYCKCGTMEDAHRLLSNMKRRDMVTYTALIGGYVQHGRFQEALDVFNNMQQEGLSPNTITFRDIIKACAGLGSLAEGRRIHASIVKAGLIGDATIKHALANMYAKISNYSAHQGLSEARA